jgi:hypothetical protein
LLYAFERLNRERWLRGLTFEPFKRSKHLTSAMCTYEWLVMLGFGHRRVAGSSRALHLIRLRVVVLLARLLLLLLLLLPPLCSCPAV